MLLTYENETENHPRSSTQRHLCFFSEYSMGPHFVLDRQDEVPVP